MEGNRSYGDSVSFERKASNRVQKIQALSPSGEPDLQVIGKPERKSDQSKNLFADGACRPVLTAMLL